MAAVISQSYSTDNKRKNLFVTYFNSWSQNTGNDIVCKYTIWDGKALYE